MKRTAYFFFAALVLVFNVSCKSSAEERKERGREKEREREQADLKLPGGSEEEEEEEGGPGNPGWFRQLYEMKKGEDGTIDWKLFKQVRTSVKFQRMEKGGGGVLENIQELGPDNVGGRTRAFLVDAADENHLFAGGISGGLWTSTDKGDSWTPVNDDVANLSVTFITQNPFNPDILYYCSGEVIGNSADISGDGIYKSTDNGATFNVLPNSQIGAFDNTWRIVHSLVDSNTIYIGTGSSGLYRSTDGGNSFQNLMAGQITDIEVFADSSIIAARHSSGLFYSPNGNPGTFTPLGAGLPPSGGFERLEMAYCKSAPNVMYVAYESPTGDALLGVYRSTDGGQNWSVRLDPQIENIGFYFPWYCLILAVSPVDPDIVVIGGVDMGVSTDGATNWVKSYESHADNHIAYFNPFNPSEFYVGNDGGLYQYTVSGHFNTWETLNHGYNVTQFYAGTFFPSNIKYWAGAQDNGTQAGVNSTQATDHIFGGDGAFTAVNQQIPTTGYVSWQNGHILKCTDAFSQFPTFNYVMNEMDNDGDFNIDESTWFINPFEINRQDGDQLYFVTQERLWRSIDGASSWEHATNTISNLYAIGVSNEVLPTVYVAGTGKLRRIDNAIGSFPGDEVNLGGSIPTGLNTSFWSCITVSPNQSDVFYISSSSYINQPRIYKVTNAKTTPVWTSIHGDLPQGLPVNWVEVSPYSEDILVAATDFGLYTTSNGGQNWILEDAIPNVPVDMVRLRHSDNKLFIYTHGRGTWMADVPTTGMGVPAETAFNVKIYPTVTDDKVQVDFPEAGSYLINLYNTSGSLVATTLYEGNNASFSIQGLSSGVYYTEIISKSKQQRVTQKIVRR